ncbi:hypothetical protein [Pseudaminobacter sp. NGMCC 1.201702]|uniref:hypothetical protein n=1 Tax=Pseudaminobacter sp. NGMCC 1.201702 TaxID=3391825 RepID=UPI0039EF3D10
MRKYYEEQIAIIEHRIRLMQEGNFSTRTMTAENPVWVDTTASDIEHDKKTVEMLKGVISRFYPKDGK